MDSAEALTEAIRVSGKSRQSLAEETGLSRSTIDRMCRQDGAGYLWSWRLLARALGVQVDELIGENNEA